MKIPLVDLRAQNVSLRQPLEAAAIRVLWSGRYGLGPEVDDFERAFADYCETSYSVAVNSGTSALHLALLACGIGKGDEVITVAFTFVATLRPSNIQARVPFLSTSSPMRGQSIPRPPGPPSPHAPRRLFLCIYMGVRPR